MKCFWLWLLLLAMFPVPVKALQVGIGKTSLTPTLGTPSAGYANRLGRGMDHSDGTLLAVAVYLDPEESEGEQFIFCSVDHLGFSHDMVATIQKQLAAHPELDTCQLYIASSHTHSGGGAYLNIPIVGGLLAGAYCPKTTQWYCDQTVQAILEAYACRRSAKLGVGYGKTQALAAYRGKVPADVAPLQDMTVIKITTEEDVPLAMLCHYPMHPTVLESSNWTFSADFVGSLRAKVAQELNPAMAVLYLNGAQAEILPSILENENRLDACKRIGSSLAHTALDVWSKITTQATCEIVSLTQEYTFTPQPNCLGLTLPIKEYESTLSCLFLNSSHAFLMVPGELSTLYDRRLKKEGELLGYKGVTVCGLINDAHGYMLLPEAWRVPSTESRMSFGGPLYGDWIYNQLLTWLEIYQIIDLSVN